MYVPYFYAFFVYSRRNSLHIFHYFTSQLSLGLDINSSDIRLLALRQKKGHIYIEKMAVMALPFGAVVEGKIQQAEVVTAYLKTIVQKTHVFNQKVTIALPSQSVISKKITLDEAVSINHVQDYFPGVKDALAYDYIEIDKEMLIMATRQDELMRYVTLVENAGLKVGIVDIDLYALARAAHFALGPKTQSYPICLLELNPLGSQLILLNQHNILYQQAILGTIEQIGEQLKIVLKTYFSNEEGAKKIYLLNNKPNVGYLIEYMDRELFVETEQINLLAEMPRHHKVNDMASNHFLVCFGLALRGFRSC